MDTPTADDVLNDAAVELGLKTADLADPFASTDQNIVLLCRLLKRVGRRLVRARDWTHLTREYTFNTANGTASYALPSGFSRMRDATSWNRDTTQPLGPPVDGTQWQTMKARTATGLVAVPFRIFGNLLYIYPTPTSIEAIYYEYVTNFWVMPTGQTAPTTSEPTTTTDTLWFDEDLLVSALKLAFCRAKGMPQAGDALDEYKAAWASAAGSDGAAPDLELSLGTGRYRFGASLPDTGWGT